MSKKEESKKETTEKSQADLKKEKLAKLASFETAMAKKYGEEIIQDGATKKDLKIDTVSTGSVSLDSAIGVGGFPKGRIVEVFGPEASGKTTLALQAIANAQKKGGLCMFIDVEQALDVAYSKLLGVKFDETLKIVSPEFGEQALQIAREAAESGAFDVIVLDSVAALVSEKELDGEMADQSMGLLARMMSKGLRTLVPVVKQNNVLLIFINQNREKIGGYGNPIIQSGGKALPYAASLRISVRKMSGAPGEISLKIDGVDKPGYVMIVKIVKNKLNSPQEEVNLPIIYGYGIDSIFDLYSAAKLLEVIQVTGRTHTFKEKVLGKSADEALQFVRADLALAKEIEKEVRKKLYEKN